MYKSLLMLLLVQVFSINVLAEPLNLKLDPQYDYQQNNEMSTASSLAESNGRVEIDTEKNDKSILPVILSASFLMMSLYGDNSDSSMYRAVGAAATVVSLSWYLD